MYCRLRLQLNTILTLRVIGHQSDNMYIYTTACPQYHVDQKLATCLANYRAQTAWMLGQQVNRSLVGYQSTDVGI